jgi:hypothetical protein
MYNTYDCYTNHKKQIQAQVCIEDNIKTDLKNFIKSWIVQNWQRSPILGFKIHNKDYEMLLNNWL